MGMHLQKLFAFILMVLIGVVFLYRQSIIQFIDEEVLGSKTINVETAFYVQKLYSSYGDQVDVLAKEFDLPAPYLKALIILESSADKEVDSRFEKHVYSDLQDVRSGKRRRYENITPKTIQDASDGALKNLASSWGPFQLMGYKCVLLNINVADVRGEDSLYWGVKWIDMTYGNYLRQGKYQDAFHIHNTGSPYPKSGKPRTHDPKYVDNGLAYIEAFSKQELSN